MIDCINFEIIFTFKNSTYIGTYNLILNKFYLNSSSNNHISKHTIYLKKEYNNMISLKFNTIFKSRSNTFGLVNFVKITSDNCWSDEEDEEDDKDFDIVYKFANTIISKLRFKVESN